MNKFFNYIIYFILLIIYGCIENNNPLLNNDIHFSSIEIGEVRDLFISDSTLFVGTESEGIYIYNINNQTGTLELLYDNIEWGIDKDIRSVYYEKNTQMLYALDRFAAIYHGYYPFLIDPIDNFVGDGDTLLAANCSESFQNATKFFINEDGDYFGGSPKIFILYKRNSDNELYLGEPFSSIQQITYFFDPVTDLEILGDIVSTECDDALDIPDSLSYEINDLHFSNDKFYLGSENSLDIYSFQSILDTSIVIGTEVKSVYSKDNFVLAGTDNGCYITLLTDDSNDIENSNILSIAEGFAIYDIFYDENLNKLILSSGSKGILVYDWDGISSSFNFNFRLLSSYAYTARIYNNLILVATKNGLEIFNIEG